MKGVSIREFRRHSKRYQKDISTIEKRLDSIEEGIGHKSADLHQTSLDSETKKILKHIKIVQNSIKE